VCGTHLGSTEGEPYQGPRPGSVSPSGLQAQWEVDRKHR
jgi:hypothetical protein